MSNALQKIVAMHKLPFVRKLATFQVSTISIAAIAFLSSVIQARWLGTELFGYLAVITAFAGLLNFFTSMGQETTLATFFAEAYGKKDRKEMATILRYFLQMTLFSAVIVLLLALAAPALADFFRGDPRIGQYARIPILVVALQYPVNLGFLLLQLNNRVGTIAILENVRSLLQLLLCILFFAMGYGIGGVLLSILIPALLYFPLCIAIYERNAREQNLPTLREAISTIGKGGTGPYIRQGLWITLDKSIASNIYPNAFFLALSSVTTLEVVALFKIAHRLALLPASLITPNITRLTNVQIPLLVGKNIKAMKSVALKVIKGSVGLSTLAVIGSALTIPFLIPIFYGEEYRGAIAPFLILLPLNIFQASAVVTIPLLRIFRRTYASLINTVTAVGIAYGLFFVLHQFFSPLIAMSLAIVYIYAQIVVLHFYVWYVVRVRKNFYAS